MRDKKALETEIKTLTENISKFNEMAKEGKLTDEDYADLHELVGWRDALSWVLRERWMNNFLCEQQRVVDVMEFIKHHDDEVCGAYGLWEMNSEECMSFDGNCTLCKVNKAIALLKDGVERK
jgi:galactokinase